MSHKCPGPGCSKTVDDDKLMCPGHWYKVPKVLRRAVWSAWANGDGAGSLGHAIAIRRAIESVGGKS
jgi:hypothetical protein